MQFYYSKYSSFREDLKYFALELLIARNITIAVASNAAKAVGIVVIVNISKVYCC